MTDPAADTKQEPSGFIGVITRRVEWALRQRVVRVIFHYNFSRGPLMASGLSFQAIFAVFAAVWLTFSIAGIVIGQNLELKNTLINAISGTIPSLIKTPANPDGLIDPDDLLRASVLSWASAVALIGLLVTTLGWLASARDAVRAIFQEPGDTTNFFLLKLKDLGLGLVFGIALIVSTALSAFSTELLSVALDFVGIGSDSLLTIVLSRIVGLFIVLVLDTVVLGSLYRILSSLTIPRRQLLPATIAGAIAIGALKVLGTSLLGGSRTNPLLASFAVFAGLLIWFNLVCQVILICASWIAVGMQDLGLAADPKAEATRREKERVAREQERLAREREEAERAEAAAAARAALPWWRRWLPLPEGAGGDVAPATTGDVAGEGVAADERAGAGERKTSNEQNRVGGRT